MVVYNVPRTEAFRANLRADVGRETRALLAGLGGQARSLAQRLRPESAVELELVEDDGPTGWTPRVVVDIEREGEQSWAS